MSENGQKHRAGNIFNLSHILPVRDAIAQM
jgi:hypothetical protein